MKASEARKFVSSLKSRGWVQHNDLILPPNKAPVCLSSEGQAKPSSKKNKSILEPKIKSGWIDDYRNIRNKEKQKDVFMKLVEQELGLIVWPEFFFSTERLYRLDYAIPVKWSNSTILKIGIEVQGGIWAKGNSGHSSGTGIKRDMDKSNLAQSLGWFLIKITPDELLTNKTLELIKSRL